MVGLLIIWRLRTLAFAALALAVFGAIECPPVSTIRERRYVKLLFYPPDVNLKGGNPQTLAFQPDFCNLSLHYETVAQYNRLKSS